MRRSPGNSAFFYARTALACVLFVTALLLFVTASSNSASAAKFRTKAERKGATQGSVSQPASPTGNSGPGWSVVTSPNTNDGPEPNDLKAVACNSNSDCWSVGYRDANNGSVIQTLIEHWDGNSWSIVPSPNTKSNQHNLLNAAACNSVSDCWAVGYYINDSGTNQTLIEHWDGTSWAIVSSPNGNTSTNLLEAVTCVSASNCWAVGSYHNGSLDQALIEKWDGNSWQVVASPDTISPSSKYLYGITCLSASQCWAVGNSYGTAGVDQTLIEKWDGNSWTIATSPNATVNSDNDLQSIACTSSSDCWAVGGYVNNRYQTLIEHWNGVAWTITQSPNTGTTVDNFLYGVKCVSSSACWAVGKFNLSETLVQKWDGAAWSIFTAPDAGVLFSVTCTSTTDCWAVGNGIFIGSDQTLTEHWNGAAWSTVSSPNINDYIRPNQLSGVTCASVSDCWAVGFHDHEGPNGHGDQNLAEHWDGTSWSVVDAPNVTPTSINYLQGVGCASSSDCWAVGYSSGQGAQALIERWNGTLWSIVSSPAPAGAAYAVLTGATCNSASDCWAGGYYYNNNISAEQTLVEHWNGASWSIVASPNASNSNNEFHGLTCNTASDCWAVGQGYKTLTTPVQTLIEHWNGSSWSITQSPNSSSSQSNVLNSVTCVSPSDCWSVGNFTGSAGQTLTQHWDGTTWQIVSSPNLGTPSNGGFNGVACASSSNCWAVGSYTPASGGPRTFIQHWDGNSWQISPLHTPATSQEDFLYAITCSSPSQCWAVGDYFSSSFQTLIETYSATIPPLLSAGSRMTHGNAGMFDVDLPLVGKRGVECRSGGANRNYSVVFSFVNDVTNCGTAATAGGAVVAGPNSNQCTENLTGVTNAQYVSVELDNVIDSQNNTGNVAAPMGVLIGDVNGNGLVSNGDVSLVQAQVAQTVTSSNFREDVNANGIISNGDVSITQAQVGQTLPSSP